MSRKIEVHERVFEIIEWEIHLNRGLIHSIQSEVRAAVQLGFAEQKLLDIVDKEVLDIKMLFEEARTKSLDELREARLNGYKFE